MDNKNKILFTALELFSNKGYEGVGVQEIVTLSGVTKPTLYHYFGCKLGLLETLLKEFFYPFFENLKEASKYQNDLSLTLFRIVKVYFNFAQEQKNFYRMQLGLNFSGIEGDTYKLIKPFYKEQYNFIEKVFLGASKHHGNMKGRESTYTATFIGLINTYITLYLNENIVLNDECIYKAVHQFMHGIYS